MRTTASIAASPRSLHWQACVVANTYTAQPSPPVMWRHVAATDAPVVKWSDGLYLTWVIGDESNSNNG
jgi:hypothetical protein